MGSVATLRAGYAVGARRRAGVMAACTAAALALLHLEPEPAGAHSVSIGQSKIYQQGEVVRYDLAVSYEELAKRIELESETGSPPQAPTDAEREGALRNAQSELTPYLGAHVRVLLDGEQCDDALESVGVVRHRGQLFAVISLAYRCPESVSDSYEVHYGVFFDSQSDAEMASHTNVADYRLGGFTGRFVFEPGTERLAVGGPDDEPTGAERPGVTSSLGRFIQLGFEHILSGVDHLLFILVLLLGARSASGVLKVATAFTIAHSVTLALAAMGWVSVPGGVVEPLIALSIAYVAVENMTTGESRHRPLVVFGFGLMHGLGFAGALSFTGIPSLLAFNFGIELGQALIMLLVWPLLLLARRLRWQRLAQMGASGMVGSLGVLWLLDRLFVP